MKLCYTPLGRIPFKILLQKPSWVFLSSVILYFLSTSCWADTSNFRKFNLTIKNSQIIGHKTTLQVQQGNTVEIKWNADVNTELHLHGYNILFTVIPDNAYQMKFKAHTAGRFPISIHGKSDHNHGHRSLVYIEVYPE